MQTKEQRPKSQNTTFNTFKRAGGCILAGLLQRQKNYQIKGMLKDMVK